MFSSDRKVWSRHLEREKKSATLSNPIDWMTVEMKSRMRATAPVRSNLPPRRAVNSAFGKIDFYSKSRHKCWFCSNSSHWPDQCKRFVAMKADERRSATRTHRVLQLFKKSRARPSTSKLQEKKAMYDSRRWNSAYLNRPSIIIQVQVSCLTRRALCYLL